MPAPVASGWSGRRVGLAPTGKRRLFTAHTRSGSSIYRCYAPEVDKVARDTSQFRMNDTPGRRMRVIRGQTGLYPHLSARMHHPTPCGRSSQGQMQTIGEVRLDDRKFGIFRRSARSWPARRRSTNGQQSAGLSKTPNRARFGMETVAT